MSWLTMAACLVAAGMSALRWLRVAQREHYLPDATSRFAIRWWTSDPANAGILAVALLGLVLVGRWPAAGLLTAVATGIGPVGLGLRGRTSPLAWTRRLRTLAAVSGAIAVVIVAGAAAYSLEAIAATAVALAMPGIVDLGCYLTGPFERRAASRYVDLAAQRLRRVGPRVVAITGSYGKTSTKRYITHLADGSMAVVASPASFNNRAGLARAINEHLADGTDVFVAEMGTYGVGEIADLCSWIVPDIAVITAIGPVHLERFGSEDRIVEAKSEILRTAPVVVLPVDDDRLRRLAMLGEEEGKRVIRCSVGRPAEADSQTEPNHRAETDLQTESDQAGEAGGAGRTGIAGVAPDLGVVPMGVRVVDRGGFLDVYAGGRLLTGDLKLTAHALNLACAVAVALELGVEEGDIAGRLPTMPAVTHRLEMAESSSGCVVIDDTYNSNPAGARAALAALAAYGSSESGGADGRRAVVTPGMVELGRRQAAENERFATEAARIATDLVVVGRTNRRALLAGARRGAAADGGTAGCRVVVVPDRERAVAWVRENLGAGDVVLYENDLPDHYP